MDDLETIRKILISQMKKFFDFDFYEATTAEEAEELINKINFDLITLDLNLPGKSGVDFLKDFRKYEKNIPVILITESRIEDGPGVLLALHEGAQHYLCKGNLNKNPAELKEVVSSFLDRKSNTFTSTSSTQVKSYIVPEVILFGASTGGTTALVKLLKAIPKPCPPIFVVQHIDPSFAQAFGERFSSGIGFRFN